MVDRCDHGRQFGVQNCVVVSVAVDITDGRARERVAGAAGDVEDEYDVRVGADDVDVADAVEVAVEVVILVLKSVDRTEDVVAERGPVDDFVIAAEHHGSVTADDRERDFPIVQDQTLERHVVDAVAVGVLHRRFGDRVSARDQTVKREISAGVAGDGLRDRVAHAVGALQHERDTRETGVVDVEDAVGVEVFVLKALDVDRVEVAVE